MNLRCVGEKRPTVVFLQGGEGNIANWKQVAPAVAALGRICVLDRPGFGWSDPAPGEVTGLAVTDQLRAALRRGGAGGPYVFVGHSIGGFYATLYADRFPQEVAGLVLVDPGFAGQYTPASPEELGRHVAGMSGGEDRLRRCAALARAGQLSEAAPQGCFSLPADAGPAERAYLLNAYTRPNWHEAELSQSLNYFPHGPGDSVSAGQEIAARRDFGELPMAVLTAERFPRNAWDSDAGYAERDRQWKAGHTVLAARSRRARHLQVAGAGHFIQRDRPDVVIRAIEEVVDEVRARAASATRGRWTGGDEGR